MNSAVLCCSHSGGLSENTMADMMKTKEKQAYG